MAATDSLPPPPPPPPPVSSSNSSKQRDEERRRRLEREKRKQQEAAAAARNRPAETSGRTTNWLKRETPFVCNIQFRNDLPEVPCEPKMLVTPLNPQQLAAFKLTSLETDPQRDLVFEPDLGIPLSVFDIHRYSVLRNKPPLAPEDLALVEGDDEVAAEVDTPGNRRVRTRLRGDKAELSWLMRTTYISNEQSGTSQAKGIREKEAKTMREMAMHQDETDLQSQIANIEASFEAARQPPVHQKNPSLTPVEILPILPDEERWPNDYVQMVFDGEPTADVPSLRSTLPEHRRRYADHSVLKPYKIAGDTGQKDTSFLVLMLPKERPESDACPSEAELQWVREYTYDMRGEVQDRDFVFQFNDDGTVTYIEMSYKLVLRGKGKRMQMSDRSQRFNKPSRITLKRRAQTEAEEGLRTQKRQDLRGETYGPEVGDEQPSAEEAVAADAAAAAEQGAEQEGADYSD